MSLQGVRKKLVGLMQRVSRPRASRAARAPAMSDLNSTAVEMPVSPRVAGEAHPGAPGMLASDEGLRAPQARGDTDKVRIWRRRVLLRKGARIHSTMSANADDGLFAMLDSAGMVVCCYRGASDGGGAVGHLVDRHMSQFYVPEDIAISVPHRDLRVAVVDGSSTQQGWRRQSNDAVFWGTTIIDALMLADGRLQGFSLVTRRSRGPWENARTAKERASKRSGATTQPSRRIDAPGITIGGLGS